MKYFVNKTSKSIQKDKVLVRASTKQHGLCHVSLKCQLRNVTEDFPQNNQIMLLCSTMTK